MSEVLARRFHLPFHLPYDSGMQDWELEVCDAERVSEFLEAYEEFDAPIVKHSLIELVAFSYDDYIAEFGRNEEIEKKLTAIMVSEWVIHANTARYWAFIHENLYDAGEEIDEELRKENEECMPSVPFMKQVWFIGQKLNESQRLEDNDTGWPEVWLLQKQYEGERLFGVTAVKAVCEMFQVDLGQAKMIVNRSSTWRRQAEQVEPIPQLAMESFKKLRQEELEENGLGDA